MCGIVGSFNPNGPEVCPESTIKQMRDRMTHRGPDGHGVWRSFNGKCALGHRRLSIIDLSQTASQPMLNEDGSVVLVFNGEIYNHADIRKTLEATGKYQWKTDHSDTEVLLHAYEEWGLACIERFYGMFAFAVYDARNPHEPVMHFARDRAGVKPLYFTKTSKGEWVFASEIRALFAHPDISREMDPTAFWHYLTFIVAPAPLTMFKNIFKLPAAHTMTIRHDGTASARPHWDCRPNKADLFSTSDLSKDEATEALLGKLRDAVSHRMVSDVPFGALLSGGVDSSLLVALMDEQMSQPVKTFTVGYERYDELNEFDHAQRVAKRYGTDHHEMRIDSKDAQDFIPHLVQLQDEPIADNVCIPLYFLSKLVQDSGTTVVQVGEGADENLLGYWWCDHYRQKQTDLYQPILRDGFRVGANATQEDIDIQARALAGEELFLGGAVCWQGGMRNQLTPHPQPFRAAINCPVEGLLPDDFRMLDSAEVVNHYVGGLNGHLEDPDVLQKIPYLEMKLRIPEHLLMRVDKMTMANSIEARVPFLDHDVVEFARRLPPSYKLRDGIGKKVLKKAAEPYVDHDLLYRRKQGFGAPMDQWFKEKAFGQKCVAAFERSRIRKEGFLDNEYFEDLLKHQMGSGNGYGFHLWTVLNAVLWHECWIEGNTDCFS
jgi:asparagine synthase (glutamine-hydrolysing)